MRPALTDTFIPVQSQPFQGVEDLLVGLFGVTLRVRIFNAEDERSAGVTRIRPVEQAGAYHSDVRSASW